VRTRTCVFVLVLGVVGWFGQVYSLKLAWSSMDWYLEVDVLFFTSRPRACARVRCDDVNRCSPPTRVGWSPPVPGRHAGDGPRAPHRANEEGARVRCRRRRRVVVVVVAVVVAVVVVVVFCGRCHRRRSRVVVVVVVVIVVVVVVVVVVVSVVFATTVVVVVVVVTVALVVVAAVVVVFLFVVTTPSTGRVDMCECVCFAPAFRVPVRVRIAACRWRAGGASAMLAATPLALLCSGLNVVHSPCCACYFHCGDAGGARCAAQLRVFSALVVCVDVFVAAWFDVWWNHVGVCVCVAAIV
jgi:hypothetical protein